MERPIQVVICGQSIVWAAVEAVLDKLPNVNIRRCAVSDLCPILVESSVDVIMFDSQATFMPLDLPVDPASGPLLLKLNFGDYDLVEPLFNWTYHPEFDDLIVAIQENPLDSRPATRESG